MAIVRSGRSLGMVLHAKGGEFTVPNSSDCVVIEVSVRDFQALRQALLVDRKAMILRRDFNSSVY